MTKKLDLAALAVALPALLLAACGNGAKPFFPDDYQQTYIEVRDCRRSADHDLNYIRVLVVPDALEAYTAREDPFPVGAIVLKEEFADAACTDLDGFTVMRKEAAGTAPESGDWAWQKLTAEVEVNDDPDLIGRCIMCHAVCVGPIGHDFTCADP